MAANRERPSGVHGPARPLATALPHVFAALGTAWAAVLYATGENTIPVRFPAFLAMASMLLWPRFAGWTPQVLQTVVGVYLCVLPLGGIMTQSLTATLAGHTWYISWGVLVAAVTAAGHGVQWAFQRGGKRGGTPGPLAIGNWVAVLAILGVHMVFVAALLEHYYGYGYEQDVQVCGQLCLLALACWALAGTVGHVMWRRCLCGGLVLYYFALAVGMR